MPPNRRTPRRPDSALIGRFQEIYGDVVGGPAGPGVKLPGTQAQAGSASGGTALQTILPQHEPSNDDLDTHFPSAPPLPPLHTQPNAYGQGSSFLGQPDDLLPSVDPGLLHPASLLAVPNQLVETSLDVPVTDLGYSSSFHPADAQNTVRGTCVARELDEHVSILASSGADRDSSSTTARIRLSGERRVAPETSLTDRPSMSTSNSHSRFNVTLQAATAMEKRPNESPFTYLNRGKVYLMSVVDTIPQAVPPMSAVKYRTCIRILFEDQEQRSEPAVHWRLWEKNRRSRKAYEDGREQQAVEYVDSIEHGSKSREIRQAQLQSASLDGFSVTWEVDPAADTADSPGYTIPIRFNVLSTDFSFSKGVKGIPLRLYAKTEILAPDNTRVHGTAEARFCNIKVFRDHGAERKLANDARHVSKQIEKLTSKISQEAEGHELGSVVGRRRFSTAAKRSGDHAGNAGEKSVGNDLCERLAELHDTLMSTRPESVLNLPGDQLDDPDLCPIRPASRSPSSSKDLRRPFSEDGSPIEGGPVQEMPDGLGVTDIDPSYQPQPQHQPKPILCLYVRFDQDDDQEQERFYRAVYLMKRTAHHLTEKIAQKQHIDPSRIVRMVKINQNGLIIVVDDDFVGELVDGQDMVARFSEIPPRGKPVTSHPKDPAAALEVVLTF